MHLKWLPIGLVVAVSILVRINSVTAAEEEEGEQRAAAISNLSFRQVCTSFIKALDRFALVG